MGQFPELTPVHQVQPNPILGAGDTFAEATSPVTAKIEVLRESAARGTSVIGIRANEDRGIIPRERGYALDLNKRGGERYR